MKTLTIVIPLYNEEKRIKKTIQALSKGFSFNGLKLQSVLFVDDGSTDKTVKKLKTEFRLLRKKLKTKIRIIGYKENRGKGFAIKTGLLESGADYTLFMDADMSTPLPQLSKFRKHIKENVDFVIGTRKNSHSTVIKHQPLYRELLGRSFTLLANIILNTWVTDFTCGFKMISKRAKDEIFSVSRIEGWGYDAEILFIAKTRGHSIKEVPVRWSNDKQTKVNLVIALPKTLLELLLIRLNGLFGVYDKSSLFNLVILKALRENK